jgi:tRNA 2-thiocytidine biosynthesis protein TtcA
VAEKDLARWGGLRLFRIIPCTLCGSQENLQRKQVGRMLKDWEKQFPGRIENMFSALQNVVPSHLMDTKLHPFTTLKATGVPSEDGDKAFDEEPLPVAPATAPLDAAPFPTGNAQPRNTVIPISVTH